MTKFDTDDETSDAPVAIPQLVSVADVAIIFGCSIRTIHRWIARGLLDPVRVDRSVFIRVDDVLAIVSGRITDRILAGR